MKAIGRHPHLCRRRGRISALLAFGLCAIGPCPIGVSGAARAQSAPAPDERHYAIQAQPVARALAQFATVSGVNILYPQSLAGDHRSTPVNGVFTAPLALRRLLQGTGLTARFTSPRSAIIFVAGSQPPPQAAPSGSTERPSLRLDMAEVRAPLIVGGPDRRALNQYALAVQAEIMALLKKDGAYEGRTFRIEIAIAIDRRGRIAEVTLPRPSGERAWDDRIHGLLIGQVIGHPPPDGLNQVMRFEIETDRLAGRSTTRGGGTPRR